MQCALLQQTIEGVFGPGYAQHVGVSQPRLAQMICKRFAKTNAEKCRPLKDDEGQGVGSSRDRRLHKFNVYLSRLIRLTWPAEYRSMSFIEPSIRLTGFCEGNWDGVSKLISVPARRVNITN